MGAYLNDEDEKNLPEIMDDMKSQAKHIKRKLEKLREQASQPAK